MKSKLFALFVALYSTTSMSAGQTGTCGENLTWDLTSGVLTISGTGDMYDYYDVGYIHVPWESARIRSVVITEGVTSIGNNAFNSFYTSDDGELTAISIASSVTRIGKSAFAGLKGLTSILIPESVTEIGYGTFSCCSGLISVNIPEGVSVINGFTFQGCTNLTSIVIPDAVTAINNSAFEFCTALSSIVMSENLTSIGEMAFWNCSSLTSIDFPDSLKSIGTKAFWGCTGLTEAILPNSVIRIGEATFLYCTSLANIDLPDSITTIGIQLFCGCSSITEINIPESVTLIADKAFYGCTSLTSVDIPNSVTSIEGNAFNGCTAMTSLTIGSGVKSIGYLSFANCKALQTVTCLRPTPPIMAGAFESTPLSIIPLYVPAESVAAYRAHYYWKSFNPILPIGSLYFNIAFNNWDGQLLLSLRVPEGEMPVYTGAPPIHEGDAQYSYTFDGWSPSIEVATQDTNYTATFTQVTNQYTVTFLNDDSTVLSLELLDYGTMPMCPEPKKEEDEQFTYTFEGWQPEVTVVEGDATYIAVFTAIEKVDGMYDVQIETTNVPIKLVTGGKLFIHTADHHKYSAMGVKVE